MLDCHIHLEKGPYTKEWLDESRRTRGGSLLNGVVSDCMQYAY
jgi:hypothetical protein